MFETGDFQTPAPPESGVAGNAVASTPQDHWLYNELADGFHIDRVVRDYNYSMDIRHIHEEYEIYYLLEGERYYFINQRRKTLVNGLGNAGLPGITKESAAAALAQMGLSPTVRGEALTLEQFARLSDLL